MTKIEDIYQRSLYDNMKTEENDYNIGLPKELSGKYLELILYVVI